MEQGCWELCGQGSVEGHKSLQAADLGSQFIASTAPKPDGVGKVLVGWDPRRHCSPCSFLVSVLYSKAKLASACGGIIYFLSYVPYMYVAIREEVAHDKITAFEKCIAVSWLQQLHPRFASGTSCPVQSHQAVTKPWASHCLYKPNSLWCFEGISRRFGASQGQEHFHGAGWGSSG